MTLPPGQFLLHFLIKSLIQLLGKWPWCHLGSFHHISLLDPYQNAWKMTLEPLGSFLHISSVNPYRNAWKIALVPPRQFPSQFLIESLFKMLGK